MFNFILQLSNLNEIQILLKDFMRFNDEYHAHLLVIGGFSAGKSALLNKFIGKHTLAESQIPETVFATELLFSEEEYITVHEVDHKVERVDCLVNKNLNQNQVSYLTYYINSERLKNYPDYIFVDTPGFDSGIEQHNKALMQYIGKGTAYILVVDADKGTLSESTLKFIREINDYSDDIGIIVNKCDKKLPEEIEKIKAYISSLVMSYLGRDIPIITTSINFDTVVNDIEILLKNFNAQYLYDKYITNEIEYIKQLLIESVDLIRSNQVCDVEDIEVEIKNREEAKLKLRDSIEKNKKEISKSVRNHTKDRIITNIKSELETQVDYLTSGILISNDILQERIIEIIRPILMEEAEAYSQVTSENIVNSLKLDTSYNMENQKELQDVLLSINNKLRDMIEKERVTLSNNWGNIYSNRNEKNNGFEKGKALYRTISSVVAITTQAIVPILELIIVFLPDIISLFQGFFGEKPEDKARSVIFDEVIPQVINKLRTELDVPLAEIEESMIEDFIININQLIDSQNEALKSAIDRKNSVIEKYNEIQAEIESDLKEIMEL